MKITTKNPDDPTLQLPAGAARLALPLMAGGGILLVSAMVLGLMHSQGMRFAMGAYYTAFMYCLTIALGATFFVVIQHLCRAGWSVTVRRIAELYMSTLPVLAVLFLPVVATLYFGDGTLFSWDSAAWVNDHHPEWAEPGNSKGYYLSDWFFTLRALLYLIIWVLIARYFYKTSRLQDSTAELRLTERMQALSGPAVILFSLSLSFAAFDWLMSMEPAWFSTMFGVYIFAGGILSALSTVLVTIFMLQRSGVMRQEVTVEHYHDLGKLIFGFITFWTYIAFSQFLLIWYANIPEETFWFKYRQENGWYGLTLLLPACHWLLPFIGTMSRHVRRRPAVMCFWAIWVLVVHYVDIYWIIMPTLSPDSPFGGVFGVVISLLSLVGMVGLFVGAMLRSAESTPLIPVRDPRLHESLAFHNI